MAMHYATRPLTSAWINKMSFNYVKVSVTHFLTRAGVAGAVVQTASSLSDSLIHPFPPNLQDIINPKPLEHSPLPLAS